MTEWNVVRYDTTWEEKIDPEILPLCDALNAAGLTTLSSCCGHGQDWPHVIMSGSIPDDKYERLQRYLLANCAQCSNIYLPCMRKDIVGLGHLDAEMGHYWDLEIHASEVYRDTPIGQVRAIYEVILDYVTSQVELWARTEPV